MSREPLYRPPRQPNHTLDVEDILATWNAEGSTFVSLHMVAETGVSETGAISWKRSSANLTAPTLPRWYPGFAEYLENGVRDLCLFFVQELRAVTYTSCEGHLRPDGAALSSTRHVGLLPRDLDEHRRLHEFMRYTVLRFRADGAAPAPAVSLGIIRHRLYDPRGSRPVLDLEFAPAAGADMDAYLTEVDAATERYLEIARARFRLIERGADGARIHV